MKLPGRTLMHKFELKEIDVSETYDTKGDLHSFNDKHAWKNGFNFLWRKHNQSYREDKKPSHIFFEGVLWSTETEFIKAEHVGRLFPSNETTWEDGNVKI
jgi:hypothetical protein